MSSAKFDFNLLKFNTILINILKAVLETKDLIDLLDTIRKELAKIINVRNFYVALYDDQQDVLNFIYHQDQKVKLREYPADKTLTKYVIKCGKSLFADEKTQLELINRGVINRAKIEDFEAKIWIGVPLKLEKKTIGVLSVQSYDDATAYTQKDLELLELISGPIALAIFRKQSEDALRESEERFRTLYDDSIVGFYRTTPDGAIIMANNACIKMLGYDSFAELASRNLEQDSYYPSYERRHFKELLEKNGQVVGFESRWKKSDGKFIYIRENARAIRNEDGKLICYDGVVEDITEKKQQETVRDIQFQITHAASTISDLYTFIHKIRQLLGEVIETRNFGLAICGDREGWYQYPYYVDQNEDIKPGFEEYIPSSLTEYCRKFGKTVLIDEEKMQALEDQGIIRLVGPESKVWLGVPLKTANGIIGVLSVQSYEDKYAFREDNIKLLDSVADTIAIVIEKKRAENALKESEQRLSLALESAGLGLWDQNFKTGEVYRNQIWAAMLGYTLEEIDNKLDFFVNLIHPDDLAEFLEQCRKVESGEDQKFSVEQRLKAKDGSWRWIYNWGRLVERDENGNPVRSIGTHLDITHLKETERELRLHQEHTKLINSILRHDIANTFAVISSALKIYRRSGDSALLDEADIQIKKGISLINKMKKLEDYFSLSTQLKKVKLADLIKDIAASYIYLKTTITGDAEIFADEALSSVFDNLFANASKHGNADEIKVQIIKNDVKCLLVFADNGKGIPDEIKGKIFEKAFKSGKTGNTGLGLYIIKKTIERYCGSIRVEDNIPIGAKFIIELKCE